MSKKRPGLLVVTPKGKRGRTYNDEDRVNGKVRVYLIDDKFQLTGDKLLVNGDSLSVKGMID